MISQELLGSFIRPDRAEDYLRQYYCDVPLLGARYGFSGRYFNRLGGGGDAQALADRFTAGDLVAVECLGVRIPSLFAVDLLEGGLGRHMRMLLQRVPIDIAMGSEHSAEHVGEASAATAAWKALEDQHDVGWVTAGKLMARKRPHLLPVYDNVVRCALGAPTDFWVSLDDTLRCYPQLSSRLTDLRLRAALSAEISLLRVLDVVIWMSHRDDHRAGQCARRPRG